VGVGTGLQTALDRRQFITSGTERSMILERQREGIAIAKAAGKYKGRKAALSQDQARELSERLANGESVTALAGEYGVSRQTVYNYRAA